MDVRLRRRRVRFLRRGRRPTKAACEGGAPTAHPPPAATIRSLRCLLFCECLNLCCFLEVYDAAASGTAMPACSLLIACTRLLCT
jgi:hypothetical protein